MDNQVTLEEVKALVYKLPPHERELITDGYHTFKELYEHRCQLWVTLCNLKHELNTNMETPEEEYMPVWKTKLHSDGSYFQGWFILGMSDRDMTSNQMTYHLPMHYWEQCFFAKELEKAPNWDGHTSDDVLKRLKTC